MDESYDVNSQQGSSVNFYRRFHNQTRKVFEALNDRIEDNCKLDRRNLQPEIYWEIDKSFVQFDEFDGWQGAATKSK